jgi:hypothetical protein
VSAGPGRRRSGRRALHAAAALALGRVALADGDATTALGVCERALSGWMEVGAPYEAAAVRLVLAEAHRVLGRDECAHLEETAARSALDRMAVGHPVDRTAPDAGSGTMPVFRLDGDVRTVGFAQRTVLLHDLKGMRYLARLLGAPDREFHVLDLLAGDQGGVPPTREGTRVRYSTIRRARLTGAAWPRSTRTSMTRRSWGTGNGWRGPGPTAST